MQPCSVKRYLQILRFQSLLHIRLTSQEEKSLGGERVSAWELKGGENVWVEMRSKTNVNACQNRNHSVKRWAAQWLPVAGVIQQNCFGVLQHWGTVCVYPARPF